MRHRPFRHVTLAALAALALIPAPAQAQEPILSDTVSVDILANAVDVRRTCNGETDVPATLRGYPGDQFVCTYTALDEDGNPAPARFDVVSTNPDLLQVGVQEFTDSAVVTLTLLARGSASFVVNLYRLEVLGALLRNEGTPEEFLMEEDLSLEVGEVARFCGYLASGTSRVAKSAPECPGDLPVVGFVFRSLDPAVLEFLDAAMEGGQVREASLQRFQVFGGYIRSG